MSRRRLLHSASLFKKIMENNVHTYLNKKVTHRTEVHNLNLRHKDTLIPPLIARNYLKPHLLKLLKYILNIYQQT